MKKKLVSLLLATTMVAGLAGCGGSNGGSADTSATTDSKTETSATTADPVIQLLLKQQILILLSM